jgi:hypothetical protein
MTQANQRSQPINGDVNDDDDMLPEYDFSKMGKPIRNKYAERMRQEGYSVTIHHEDGTSTTHYVSPEEVQQRQDQRAHTMGDKIGGDKVMGNKMQIATVQGDAIAGDKITHYNSPNLAQAAKEIQDLLEQLDLDYDRTTPTSQAMMSAKAIEKIDQNPTLKARVVNALKEGGTTALESAIDHPAVKPVVALLKGFMDAK